MEQFVDTRPLQEKVLDRTEVLCFELKIASIENAKKSSPAFQADVVSTLTTRLDLLIRAFRIGVHPLQLKLLIQGESNFLKTMNTGDGECYALFMNVNKQIKKCMQLVLDKAPSRS